MLYSELLQAAENLNSLAYFIEKSIDEKSHSLKISDLKTKSDDLLEIIKLNENKIEAIESLLTPVESYDNTKYLAGSRISAINKGHEVIRQLNDLDLDITNYGFVSLGGGDGTELLTEIEYSEVNFGLLLEYDFESVNKFAQNNIPFKLKNFKRWPQINLDVIECDLFDKNKLDVAKRLIKSRNLSGIVISIHAVLHELSTRSQLKSDFLDDKGNIELEKFFRELCEWHENIIIIIREPGIAENWPDEVYVSISDEYKDDLLTIMKELDDLHFDGIRRSNFRNLESQKKISCKADLAIESLTKLFYIEDYIYERREKITSINKGKIATALSAGEDLFKVLVTEPFFTGSVQANMKKYGVNITASGNVKQSTPQCFFYIVAYKGILKYKALDEKT